MAGYAFNMGQGNSPLTLDPMAEMQQAHAQAQQSKLAKLLGTAANAGAGADYSQANMIDPAATQAFQKNQSGIQDDRMASFANKATMAAAAWKSGNQQLAQGIYASLVPEAHQIAPGFDLPPQMDDSAAQAFEQFSQVAGAGGMIQSTFIDAQGNRVGIMRDGRTQVLGQNAPNNQIIDTGNGFVGVNKGNLSAAPVMMGGQPQPQAPMGQTMLADGTQANIDGDLPPNIRADIAANPQKYAGGGDVQGPPAMQGGGGGMMGQQLRSAPKPQAPSALQQRIEMAQRMGATPDQIKALVMGGNGGQDGAPASVPGDQSKTGPDYLKTLPQPVAAQVQALADGRMAFPTGTALKSPYWQGMLSAVSQFDPNFDAVNYNARAKTRADFTSGKSANNIKSLNTLAGHIAGLQVAVNKLGGTDYPMINSVRNAALSATGDTRISTLNAAKTAVANELTTVFRGTGGAEADVQGWLKQLDEAKSPDQLNATIREVGGLVESRIHALQEQYKQGMGTTKDGRAFVMPANQKFFDALRGGTPQASQDGPKRIRYDAQGNRIQ